MVEADEKRGPGRPKKTPLIETPDAFIDKAYSSVLEERERQNALRGKQRGDQRIHLPDEEVDNPFHIPKDIIPDGMSYEWKRYRYGGIIDASYQTRMMQRMWSPVPSSRHPHMVWAESDSKYIEIDGLLLMERPSYLTDEAHERQKYRANDQIEGQFRKLELEGRKKEMPANLKMRYEMMVPDDE